MIRWLRLLAVNCAMVPFLAACMMEEMVTSPAPIFQSEESRALRAFISGSTFENETTAGVFQSMNTTLERVEFTHLYRRDGTYRSTLNFIHQNPAENTTSTVTGSWNIRDEQLCTNTHTVGGSHVRDNPQLHGKIDCFPATIKGETLILRIPGQPQQVRRRVAQSG